MLDILDRRRDRHRYNSSSSSNRHNDKKSDRGYLLDEFKKEKPPTLDGEMKKS